MPEVLVILDDSRECLNAMRFAACAQSAVRGGVEILSVYHPRSSNHWIGRDIMQKRPERNHAHFEVFCEMDRDKQGILILIGDP